MRCSHLLQRAAYASIVVLGTTQPVWALGDFIIPQAAGLIVGGPALMALLYGLVYAATKGNNADPSVRAQWGSTAFWAVLFNCLLLWLLFVFDPDTWNRSDGWSATGFVLRYISPSVILAVFLIFKGWSRRAGAVVITGLLVGVGYWLLVG